MKRKLTEVEIVWKDETTDHVITEKVRIGDTRLASALYRIKVIDIRGE